MPRGAERKKRARAAAKSKSRAGTPAASEPGPGAGTKRGGPTASAAGTPENVAVAGFQLLELKRLIRLVQRTGIGELELNSGGRSVRISASPANGGHMIVSGGGRALDAAGPSANPADARAAAPAAPAAPPEPVANQKPVVSPMVGTFYRSPAPDA